MPLGAMTQHQIRLMLVLTSLTCLAVAVLTGLAWQQIPRPRPKLLSPVGIAHLLCVVALLVLCILGLVGAIIGHIPQ
jgi:hypothetical protein